MKCFLKESQHSGPRRRAAARRAPVIAVLLAMLAATAAHANAFDELRKKADSGDMMAQFEVATRCVTGRSGAPLSQRMAAVYFEKAARKGHDRAMVNLGFMYEAGRGVPKDDLEAIKWTLAAAEHGNLRAMYQMGVRFEIGHGVEPNLVIAHMWLSGAAAAGSPAAGFRLPSVRRQMSKDQIRIAEKMARTWAKGRRAARARARERARDEAS